MIRTLEHLVHRLDHGLAVTNIEGHRLEGIPVSGKPVGGAKHSVSRRRQVLRREPAESRGGARDECDFGGHERQW
jgi:hypothetical protein